MNTFITNSRNRNLKNRLTELISKSKELKFLTGFFYFSGINELYESLKSKPEMQINILVGLNADQTIHGLVEYADNTNGLSDKERFEKFLKSISVSINSDNFDTQQFDQQIRFFINLIKQDKLRIRKTYNPNHAKLYLFNIEEDLKLIRESLFITGSSNLTASGISYQDEFNVEISDYGVKDAEDYFDMLWGDAVKITEHPEFRHKFIRFLEQETFITDVTPFEAYALVLKNYIDAQRQKRLKPSLKDLLIKKGYKPYQYQLDAVGQALTIIDNYNGVIISDVVGLGKSIIACLVAKNTGKRGVIICPPGIMGDENKRTGWQKYKEDFGLYDWEIRSLGIENLQRTLELIRDNEEYEVVIIDEAHRFRNSDTKAYDILANICRNKIVILLTATPFNNTPADIFSLLSFFIVPGKSNITLDNDLDIKFREYNRVFYDLSYIKKNHNSSDIKKRQRACSKYEGLFGSTDIDIKKVNARSKILSNNIRSVIEPIMIRRNRIDLKKDPEYSKEIYELSEVKDPCELFFELSEKQAEFYEIVISNYFGENGRFKGAIYRPFIYEVELKDEEKISGARENFEYVSQTNLFDFMRRLIVKRFESSFGAFEQSINNFETITIKVREFIKNSGGKYVLDRSLIDKIYESEIDEIEEELKKFEEKLSQGNYPKSNKIYDVNKFVYRNEFLDDIESDLKLFGEIKEKLSNLKLVDNDPKLKKLFSTINEILKSNIAPKRKVIIFTEYIDTSKYLKNALEKEFPGKFFAVTGSLTRLQIDEILCNFDASYEEQGDQYDILLATDKISEGFNLNRAGAIINYDIPWNPTRVIQRVGRINRISKKVFNELYIYNFFPTVQGSDIIKSRQIASDKMFLIHNTLGEDSKIFEQDEEPSPSGLFRKIMENPENQETESFQTKIRQRYYDIETKYPEILKRIETLPPRIKVAKNFDRNNIIVFIRKGLGIFIRGIINEDNGIEELAFENIIDLIECEKDDPAVPLGDIFWENYQNIKLSRKNNIKINEQSLERKAVNNLRTLSNIAELDNFMPLIRNLIEDILEYKTLSDYTLRKIASLDIGNINKVKEELAQIQINLGKDYLGQIKEKARLMRNEVIVAVENITEEGDDDEQRKTEINN